jgi:signal transduction histidine kinase
MTAPSVPAPGPSSPVSPAPPTSVRVPPSRARVRARLAVGLTALALLVAAGVALAGAALADRLGDDPTTVRETRVEQLGDRLAVVVVQEDTQARRAAADARHEALRWLLLALAGSFVPAAGLAWLAAGRVLGSVDRALAETRAAETDRQRRLQEVVHELRTPLAVASTNLELAATDPALDADTESFVAAARRAVDRMGRTVDDLAGHGQLALAATTTVDLVEEAAALAAEHAGPARQAQVVVEVAAGPPVEVQADRAALRTTAGNLLANALRLSPAGGTVTLACGRAGDWAWLAVSDEGPGLAPRHHAKAFQRGWRGRYERTTDPDSDGRGLGLAIARQLTEAQGGRLTVDAAEGAGATFVVWLPENDDADPEAITSDGVHHRIAVS